VPFQEDKFRCPCCGQFAPVNRLTGEPFELKLVRTTGGGKIPESEARKLDRSRKIREYPGGAAGRLERKELALPANLKSLIKKRVGQISKILE
jgi:hypothetical protein